MISRTERRKLNEVAKPYTSMVKELWFVLEANENSEINDICFKVDIRNMQNYFKGGLKGNEIKAILTDGKEAKRFAYESIDYAEWLAGLQQEYEDEMSVG